MQGGGLNHGGLDYIFGVVRRLGRVRALGVCGGEARRGGDSAPVPWRAALEKGVIMSRAKKIKLLEAMARRGFLFVGEFPELNEIHFDRWDSAWGDSRRVFYSWEAVEEAAAGRPY